MDGNLLEQKCTYQRRLDAGGKLTNEEFGDALFCVGYVRGVVDGIIVQSRSKVKVVSDDGEWATPCFPETVTNSQYMKVVLKYLTDNPAKLHFPAYLSILASLNQAFPLQVA